MNGWGPQARHFPSEPGSLLCDVNLEALWLPDLSAQGFHGAADFLAAEPDLLSQTEPCSCTACEAAPYCGILGCLSKSGRRVTLECWLGHCGA